MTERTQLLHGAVLLPDWTGKGAMADAGIVWQDGVVLAVGPSSDLIRDWPGAEREDLQGCLLAPGLVNAHHHIYSALAAGLDPGRPMANFLQILDGLWWRLDRALDEETIRLSARLTAQRAIRSGCTCLFDHHASPSLIGGSLDLIRDELQSAGLSAVLCYEVTDRNGERQAREGIEENRRFASEMCSHPEFRGMVGLHALFTLGDTSLESIAGDVETFGCHVHVGEDRLDASICRELHGQGLAERLLQFGLLGKRSLIVHGLHLSKPERAVLLEHGARLVINPESNANNQVGLPRADLLAREGLLPLLGTDGMGSDMLASLRSAFLLDRATGSDPAAGWNGLDGALDRNAGLAACFFGDPLRGRLVPGARADFAVWNHVPGRVPTSSDLLGHLVFGVAQDGARHTVAAGNWLMRNGVIQSIDGRELSARIRAAWPHLERRFSAMPGGTRFRGMPCDNGA